jgi:hypothetical protein
MNLENLKYHFSNTQRSDVVVKLRNWSNPELEIEDESLYFVDEILEDNFEYSLQSF